MLDALSEPGLWWHDRANLSHVVVAGHSIGGAAALQACHVDARCVGAVNVDGAVWGSVVDEGLDHPVLILGGHDSCAVGPPCDGSGAPASALANTERLLAGLRAPSFLIRVDGAGHLDFTDLPQWWLAPGAASLAGRGSIEPALAASVTTGTIAAFADGVVHGDPDGVMEVARRHGAKVTAVGVR